MSNSSIGGLEMMNDSDVNWESRAHVVWGDLELEGVRYTIAGGPRGVLLFTQGNAGTDVISVILFAIWNGLVSRWSRKNVVKVRRRSKGLRRMFMRREFERSRSISDCVISVEHELRSRFAPASD